MFRRRGNNAANTHQSHDSTEVAAGKKKRERIDWQQLKRLFSYTKPYRKELILSLVGVSLASLIGLIFPIIVRRLFNGAFTEGTSVRWLDYTALGLIVLFIAQAVLNYFRVYFISLVGEGVVADLRRDTFSRLIKLPISFFESRKTGELTSRLTTDVTTIQSVVSTSLPQLFSQTFTLIGGTILMVVINFKLSLVMLATIPAVILAGAYFGRKLRKISTEFQDKVASANADAEEAIVGIREVKAFTAEGIEERRYQKGISASYDMGLKRARVRAYFTPTIIMVAFTAVTVILWYGGRLVILDGLPPGDLITFLLLTFFVAGSIGSFTGLYSQFQEALGSSRRVFELLDEESDLVELDNPKELESVFGAVRFEQMSFRYGDRGEENILKDLNLDVKAGEIIAIVGPSGSGKTTLVSLIPRFYDPVDGAITLDGVDLRDLGLEDLRSHIGIVPQETLLFSGSINENIRYGKEDATGDEVEAAAMAANAHEFILNFEAGYETLVGERGIKLSGGQKQRVAIARAILKDPRILILDEATSSLDSESEALVQEALDSLMQGRTTFVIAHRLSTIRNADRIIVLDEGQIVQEGSHDKLLTDGGLYKELYDKQFNPE